MSLLEQAVAETALPEKYQSDDDRGNGSTDLGN